MNKYLNCYEDKYLAYKIASMCLYVAILAIRCPKINTKKIPKFDLPNLGKFFIDR